jgi:hypothetical protein
MEQSSYAPLSRLESEYGQKKIISVSPRQPILEALSHFPELRRVAISFLPAQLEVPLHTRRSLLSGGKRYAVLVTQAADLPLREALLVHLPEEAQRAAIAQQLAIICFYERMQGLKKWRQLFHANARLQREITRQADLEVIAHGLGFELYVLAVYLRKIAGYQQRHPELDQYHLHPQEIMDTLKPEVT